MATALPHKLQTMGRAQKAELKESHSQVFTGPPNTPNNQSYVICEKQAQSTETPPHNEQDPRDLLML